MPLVTREQERMTWSWRALTAQSRFGATPAAWSANNNKESEYLSRCKKGPSLIYSSGVGQALAFLMSRGGSTGKNVAEDVESIVKRVLNLPRNQSLFGMLRTMDAGMYSAVTEEAIEAFSWLALYLQGEGVKPKADATENGGEADD